MVFARRDLTAPDRARHRGAERHGADVARPFIAQHPGQAARCISHQEVGAGDTAIPAWKSRIAPATSFKSTLEEALDAALLLHVVDASDPGFERQHEVTDKVLAEIGAQDVSHLRAFTKIDQVGDATAQAERVAYPDCFVMSARRAHDVAMLRAEIVACFQSGMVEAEVFLPWSAQQLRNQVFTTCEVLDERADESGAYLRVRGERDLVGHLLAAKSG